MADEQLDPTAAPAAPDQTTAPAVQEPATAAPVPVPVVSDISHGFVVTEPQVTPDPSPTPTTSADTPAPTAGDPAPAPVAVPVVVNNFTKRSDDDALLGSWVDVIGGPDAGRFGSYVDTVHHDPITGYPTVILIRSRDARNELLEVAYTDVRPSERTGGR